MAEDGIGQALPTVTGFAAKQAVAALRKHKIAIAPILRRAGLSEGDFEAGDGNRSQRRLSAIAQARVLEYAAEALEDSAFGLLLAEQTDPRDAGILFYVASGGKNISEALTLFARYCRIVNDAVRLKLIRTPEALAVGIDLVGLSHHSSRQNAEFGIAVVLKALRDFAGQNIRPIRAAFAHARNSDPGEFERFYGCPVEFGQASSEGATFDLLGALKRHHCHTANYGRPETTQCTPTFLREGGKGAQNSGRNAAGCGRERSGKTAAAR
jgi:hypothetical protein